MSSNTSSSSEQLQLQSWSLYLNLMSCTSGWWTFRKGTLLRKLQEERKKSHRELYSQHSAATAVFWGLVKTMILTVTKMAHFTPSRICAHLTVNGFLLRWPLVLYCTKAPTEQFMTSDSRVLSHGILSPIWCAWTFPILHKHWNVPLLIKSKLY